MFGVVAEKLSLCGKYLGEVLLIRYFTRDNDPPPEFVQASFLDFDRFDFREAPMPRFDLLDPPKNNRITVQTSRGCPHSCEFCASSILLTSRYKVKPVEKVIAER